jgi:hypothetical protein
MSLSRLGAGRESPNDFLAERPGAGGVSLIVTRLAVANALERILCFVEELLGACHLQMGSAGSLGAIMMTIRNRNKSLREPDIFFSSRACSPGVASRQQTYSSGKIHWYADQRLTRI